MYEDGNSEPLKFNNGQLNVKELLSNNVTIGLTLTRQASTKAYTLNIQRDDTNNPTPGADPTATKLEVIYEVTISGTLTQVSVPLEYDTDNNKWKNINKLPAGVSYVRVRFTEYPAAQGGNHVSVYNDTPTLIPLGSYVSQDLTGETTAFNYDIYQSGVTTPNRYVLEITKEEPTSIANSAVEYDKNYVYSGKPYMSDTQAGRPRYDTLSTGTQTITYYLPSDLATPIAGDGMALEAPINAGDYVMVIDVAAAEQSASASITQTGTSKKVEGEVIWSNLEIEYDGTSKSPSAKFLDITGSDKTLALTDTSTQTNAGKYTGSLKATARIDTQNSGNDSLGNDVATNYILKNDSISSDWEITPKKVDLPELVETTFEYLDTIVFKATSGDIYEMDAFGVITKWTKPDQTIGDTTELDFKILPDIDKNPDVFYEIDGVTIKSKYTNHKFTIQLKDKTNMMWSNKTPTDADKSDDVTGDGYKYSIVAKDLSDKTKYEIIVEYEDPQLYDGKPKTPVTKVSYKDLSTNVVTDLVIYAESNPDFPPVTTNINDAQCIVTYEDNVNVTRANSANPDDPSAAEYAQIIVDGFHFYTFNNKDYTFQIKRDKPNLITLKDDSTYEFMQATFDGDNAHISENHIGMPRTLANQPDIFLGHMVEGTSVESALSQFESSDSIRVYDQNGNVVSPSDYPDKTIGTNWKLELYESKSEAEAVNNPNIQPIDSIKVLLFGDLNGDGDLGIHDSAKMVEILSGNDTSKESPDTILYWFAACVNKESFLNTEDQEYVLSVGINSAATLTGYLGGTERFNERYTTKNTDN